MKTHSSSQSLTLAYAFEQFLEVSLFDRRIRESYAEDLASLLAECAVLFLPSHRHPLFSPDFITSSIFRCDCPAGKPALLYLHAGVIFE